MIETMAVGSDEPAQSRLRNATQVGHANGNKQWDNRNRQVIFNYIKRTVTPVKSLCTAD